MKTKLITYILISFSLFSCKEKFKREVIRSKFISPSIQNITDPSLNKNLHFDIYKDNFVYNFRYNFNFGYTTVGNTETWVVSLFNSSSESGEKYFYYNRPTEIKYIKNGDFYDIYLKVEIQLAETDKLNYKPNTETTYVQIFNDLNYNFENENKDTLTFFSEGAKCSKEVPYVRIFKEFYFTQSENEFNIKHSELEIIPMNDFDTSEFIFVESNDFHKKGCFDKPIGISKPFSIHFENNFGNKQVNKINPKYDKPY